MQNSQLPVKWVKPFAVDDANKVELPVTTATLGRASQSLGFPPITMQPPESGGVPPQGEDFNGAMNQVARFVWWQLAGGALPFDATWAGNAAIGGYPQGARIAAGDLMGEWISTVDNNTVNPDTVGTGWVPGSAYGATALVGLTNANVTLTPAQAAKPVITLAGTLTGNIQIIFPVWRSEWLVVNNTTGAFSVTVKTAAGAGVVVSQAGGQQTVWGDGTNLNALGGNSAVPLLVGTPTLSTQAAQLGQTTGRLLRTTVVVRIAGVQNISVDGGAFTTTGAASFTEIPGKVFAIIEGWGAGAGSGGNPVTNASQQAFSTGGGGGSYGARRDTSTLTAVAMTVGLAGAAGSAGGAGGAGGATSFGALLTVPGGNGSPAGVANGGVGNSGLTLGGGAPTGANLLALLGGDAGQVVSAGLGFVGASFGGLSGTGTPKSYGAGAPGKYNGVSTASPQPGIAATDGGCLIIREYA